MEVQFSNPQQMNLLGYFLRDLLKANLADAAIRTAASRLNGAYFFDANGMQTTVTFGKNAIAIERGRAAKVVARITGDLNALLEVTLGANYWKYLLARRIRIGGNVFKLLKLLRILKSGKS